MASMYSFNDFSLSSDIAYMAISEPMMLTLYTRNLPQNLQREIDFVTYQKSLINAHDDPEGNGATFGFACLCIIRA